MSAQVEKWLRREENISAADRTMTGAQESNSDQSRNRQEVTDGVSLLHGSVSCPFAGPLACVGVPPLSQSWTTAPLLRTPLGKKLRLEKATWNGATNKRPTTSSARGDFHERRESPLEGSRHDAQTNNRQSGGGIGETGEYPPRRRHKQQQRATRRFLYAYRHLP